LQAPAGNDVGCTGVLRHVQRVLISHIDDRRADLNPLGFRACRRKQRKGRAELPGEVMHTEVSPVGAEVFGCGRQVDRLQKRVRSRSRLRLGRRRPMAK